MIKDGQRHHEAHVEGKPDGDPDCNAARGSGSRCDCFPCARMCTGGGLYAVELTAITAAEVAVTRTPTKSRYAINARVVAGARDVLCASVINFIRNNCNPHLSVRRCRSG